MRFWLLFYYAIFGAKYTRWALLFFVLGMTFFFFCFVHEAFDSPRPIHAVAAPYRPKPIKLGLPSAYRRPVNPSMSMPAQPDRKNPVQPATRETH